MSHDHGRKVYYDRGRDWNRERNDFRSRPPLRQRSRSYDRRRDDRRRSRSPRRNEKDVIDENILSEISKLPEPSELWDNQQQDSGFGPNPQPPPPQDFPSENYRPPQFQPTYSSGLYDEFTGNGPPAIPNDSSGWNQMSLPPPPPGAHQQALLTTSATFVNVEDQIKKEAAIESEMRHQKAALSKQREDYMRKAGILKKELDTLKDQRNELRGDPKRSPSPDTKRFLKENTKLQLEIQNKLKTINNVVDMLNGIIGEEAQIAERESDDTPDKSTKRRSRSEEQKFNYVYYDPEMHWCRVCNEFPPTAKDYLNHLHCASHNKMAAAHMEAPWHSVPGMNEGFPSFPNAPTKRTPIRGLQFFVPSTAWYCKLCDQFIGDLHCASAHLKSVVHSKNYTNFVEQNPHWETDWMSDRQKAFEKARANKGKLEEKPAAYTSHTITFDKDGFHTKRTHSPTPVTEKREKKKDKKKKHKRKRGSSTSSSSSSSESENEKRRKIKEQMIKKDPNDLALKEWMSAIQHDNRLSDNDRKLIDSLKHKIKKEKDSKRRSPERDHHLSGDSRKRDIQRRSRESERERQDSRRQEEQDRRSPKKPDIKKMPFIGKMPIYKNLGKKSDEHKKEEAKKKEEEDEAAKKRREEMDMEIQKKVAEFKEKIAKAQLEKQNEQIGNGLLPPPQLAFVPPIPPPIVSIAPPPKPAPTGPQPTLPKDFQDALDIIFPPEVKKQAAEMVQQASNDVLAAMQSGLPPNFQGPSILGMPPFPHPLMPQMPLMGHFDLNAQLFQQRPQLYDTHVPLVSSPKPRQHNRQPNTNQNQNKNQNQNQNQKKPQNTNQQNGKKSEEKKAEDKKREEMDDLAMLGIDASDVGAGI